MRPSYKKWRGECEKLVPCMCVRVWRGGDTCEMLSRILATHRYGSEACCWLEDAEVLSFAASDAALDEPRNISINRRTTLPSPSSTPRGAAAAAAAELLDGAVGGVGVNASSCEAPESSRVTLDSSMSAISTRPPPMCCCRCCCGVLGALSLALRRALCFCSQRYLRIIREQE